MSTETGNKVGSVIIFIGLIVIIVGLFTHSKFVYSGIGVVVLFLGRVIKEYF